jgi:hypothetical protein
MKHPLNDKLIWQITSSLRWFSAVNVLMISVSDSCRLVRMLNSHPGLLPGLADRRS